MKTKIFMILLGVIIISSLLQDCVVEGMTADDETVLKTLRQQKESLLIKRTQYEQQLNEATRASIQTCATDACRIEKNDAPIYISTMNNLINDNDQKIDNLDLSIKEIEKYQKTIKERNDEIKKKNIALEESQSTVASQGEILGKFKPMIERQKYIEEETKIKIEDKLKDMKI